MDVTVLQEVIERNVPPNIKDNPTEIRAYVSRELDTIRGVIAGLSARDAFVHSDAITAEIINDKNPSAGLQIERVIDILDNQRSEEHTSELQSLMRISYAVFCLKKKKTVTYNT